MPVDTTRVISTRRTQKQISEEELKEIELKRLRGELSCAECRRLKLRCDKKVPCGSCVRRGCESICPLGILSAGQGTRFILADTEQLHRKIAEMSNRIRQLEDALAILQSTVSDERHPLLSDDHLKVKFGSEALDPKDFNKKKAKKKTVSTSGGTSASGSGNGTSGGKDVEDGPMGEGEGEVVEEEDDDEENAKHVIDALGTLTLGESGEMKYFGRSAGSETLMMAEDGSEASDTEGEGQINGSESLNYFSSDLPFTHSSCSHSSSSHPSSCNSNAHNNLNLSPELQHLESTVPLLSHREPTPQILRQLDAHLPPREKAMSLCDVYLSHGAFFFRPVKRDELYGSLVPSVYRAALKRSGSDSGWDADLMFGASDPSTSGSGNESTRTDPDTNGTTTPQKEELQTNPHATATLFFIFSLGALLDVDLAPYNPLAEHYYHLGRAALSLRPVIGSPSLETVQAVGLMATYHNLAGKRYSRDSAWCIMSLTAKLAQSFGLHRDSARWNLDAKTVQKRRNLFWEVFASDVSHSLALGRPPAIHLSYVDCEFPEDEEGTTNEAGEKQSGFWALKHHYAKHIFYSVAEAMLTAQTPNYETVLDLDRKVRELSYQSVSKPYASKEIDGEDVYFSSSLSLRDFYVSQYRTVTMIYLHRSFFAQAVLDHPTNPLMSPFGPSFLTAYRCASIIIKASVHQFDRCASMAKRIWFLLYHTFSAAVIAGTIVTRSPNSSMAHNAMKDLNVAISLFEQASDQSHRARIALTVLKRLQEKAQRSYKSKSIELGISATQPGATAQSSTSESSIRFVSDDQGNVSEDDELAIFGGQIRVVTKKTKSRDRARSRSKSGDMMQNDHSSPSSASSPEASTSGTGNSGSSTNTLQGIAPISTGLEIQSSSLSPTLSSPFGLGHHGSSTSESFFTSTSTRGGDTDHQDLTISTSQMSYDPFSDFSKFFGSSLRTQPPQLGAPRSNPQTGTIPPMPNSDSNPQGNDWTSGWDFGSLASINSNGTSPFSPLAPRREWLTGSQSASMASGSHFNQTPNANPYTQLHSASLPILIPPLSGNTVDISMNIPPSANTNTVPASFFSLQNLNSAPQTIQFGSDSTMSNEYPQASQYDLQENAGLLSSMFMDHTMGNSTGSAIANGMTASDAYILSTPANTTSTGTANGFGTMFFQGGSGSTTGAVGNSIVTAPGFAGGDVFGNPSAMFNPGAVELGLSGESKLDAGWIAFMRDCGILGMDTS